MRIPSATYRIQFSPAFGFEQARKLVPYWAALGISDIYASPIFRSRKGSEHGYDVVDPNQLNPELGTADEFERLVTAVHEAGMGWIQDFVPNHMAFDYQNEILTDVLESGKHSEYYDFFDIDWEHTYGNMQGKVLAPFLGRFYWQALEDGEITLHYGAEGLTVRYYALAFPVRIESYSSFFAHGLASLKRKLGEDHPDFIKLLGVLYVLRTLFSEDLPEDCHLQVKFIKRMLWELYSGNPEFRAFVIDNLHTFNGERGNPESFSLLDDLLSEQFFQLSFWKMATKEINYRRFFNINELISLKVEEETVFNYTHKLLFDLVSEGKIDGIRIDHVDGLNDPAQYLDRLRDRAPQAYIVVEKILDSNENLPGTWPVQGTTGYDFVNSVNGLFCDTGNDGVFRKIYSEFTGSRVKFDEVAKTKKKLIILEHMAGDVNNLAQLIKTISSKDRYGSDVTLFGLRRALAEVLAEFPVYRTYIKNEVPSETDREYVQTAINAAIAANPALLHELMFFKRFLLMEFPGYLDETRKADWVKVAMRFQQLTGPLIAKGFEDTTLYVYNKLISLNEVGGRPDLFGCSVEKFHLFNRKRRRLWQDSLNSTATHDTKRGEDVRARINVLSEVPAEWETKVKFWSRINKVRKKRVRGSAVPDRNDEYFLYQTLVGAFPSSESEFADFLSRMRSYVIKAVREAKIHTEWIKPDAEYEEAYLAFLESILDPSEENLFLKDFLPFQRKISYYGVFNSLSQTLIKITSPGVPDFYQGSELWDLNLVDPDNRRPVDFESRSKKIEKIRHKAGLDVLGLIRDMLSSTEDGRVKLFLIMRALDARRMNFALFRGGSYIPLQVTGKFKRHVVAFTRSYRGSMSLTVAPRLLTALVAEGKLPMGREIWGDTRMILPGSGPFQWLNMLTGQTLYSGNSMLVADALEHFPAALFIYAKNDTTVAPLNP